MKLLASLAVLAAASLGSASAAIIQYDTAGSVFTFIGGVAQAPGTTSFTVTGSGATATLNYFNIVNSPCTQGCFDDAPPGSNLQYGVFQTTTTGPDITLTVPAFTFVLHINNLSAGVTGLITGTSSGGSVSQNSDTVSITYSPLFVTLGSTTFNVDSPTRLPAPTTGGGAVAITGTGIGTSTVPEPSTMFLLGAGLIGVGFSARKKLVSRS